jgi:hypothetical protein
MTASPFQRRDIRLLPYPDGKTFAFTIIDDTDGCTLDIVRPIYDFLYSLGLRTTKTVWASTGTAPVCSEWDRGDTLERKEYADYIRLLRSRGFEIALHNVAGTSSNRSEIIAGLQRFEQIVGAPPAINVHHEKNAENLHFGFARSGSHLPPPFRTALLRRVHQGLRGPDIPHDNAGCSGENPASDYFWGDICKATIRYVRSNVFMNDLNTIKCSPLVPYTHADTPYVNYWFDSSNGQDERTFNAILADRNIARLRTECGCSILYTHFGKGFVTPNGRVGLNHRTKERLGAIARHPDGWYPTVSELLDRLLVFQQISVTYLENGIALRNGTQDDVPAVTLRTPPQRPYRSLDGTRFCANANGVIVLPVLPAGATVVLAVESAAVRSARWNTEFAPAWLLDVEKIASKLTGRS